MRFILNYTINIFMLLLFVFNLNANTIKAMPSAKAIVKNGFAVQQHSSDDVPQISIVLTYEELNESNEEIDEMELKKVAVPFFEQSFFVFLAGNITPYSPRGPDLKERKAQRLSFQKRYLNSFLFIPSYILFHNWKTALC